MKASQGNPPEETRWKPGQSGNPKGLPKGTLHLSTHIQNLLNDPEFEFIILGGKDKGKTISYKGAPVKAIIGVAIHKAMKGDVKWGEWLAKHGYGIKMQVNGDDPVEVALRELGLLDDAGQAEGSKDKTS